MAETSTWLTAHVFSANFGAAVDKQLNDVETARLNRFHDRRRSGQRFGFERRAVVDQVLNNAANARVSGHV